ncbi:uncharacterized protein Z519_00771 [Cladophialophora bantiana CBS 173.52]|uniref:Alpha-L-arabinofuranosidase 1 catalytic domain-containing protein n=1 Tax=Cladophialophora bantiana (strain ATCC 10958 / CBS 173.52 / CDC B-1940 / NIH 8579) TaxID=1442370 RepID=A0A0D2I071_CLAB1|nr:uncharacterized protein Z519_00771 [Cladophialophora bantiana CBS 173.52]KIW99108.1 hypothetical protein Z519_00771 [Cladophialophora bantiana CBS 173.52]
MHEDISHSGNGGIYGEALLDRALQGSSAITGSSAGIPGNTVLAAENLILPWGPITTVWRGVGDVSMSLALLHHLSDALPVALELDIPFNATGESTSTIRFNPGNNISSFEYTQYAIQLTNAAKAPNSSNTFAITFDAAEVAGNPYYLFLVSIFPETFNDRANGIRRYVGSKVLRFPRGNNLEGLSVDRHWKWNETIGPLKDRKGHWKLGICEY